MAVRFHSVALRNRYSREVGGYITRRSRSDKPMRLTANGGQGH